MHRVCIQWMSIILNIEIHASRCKILNPVREAFGLKWRQGPVSLFILFLLVPVSV